MLPLVIVLERLLRLLVLHLPPHLHGLGASLQPLPMRKLAAAQRCRIPHPHPHVLARTHLLHFLAVQVVVAALGPMLQPPHLPLHQRLQQRLQLPHRHWRTGQHSTADRRVHTRKWLLSLVGLALCLSQGLALC